jgi:hypothetical protein
MKQLSGNAVQVQSLVETVFESICVFVQDEELYTAYEFNAYDDAAEVKWDETLLTTEARIMLDTVLFYRLKDKFVYSDVQVSPELVVPQNHIRITCALSESEKRIEDLFIYNNIEETRIVSLPCPINNNFMGFKAEIVAINLTEQEMRQISLTAKMTKKGEALANKVDRIGSKVSTATRIGMKQVINPTAKAAASVAGTIVSGAATTAVDCALSFSNEVLRNTAELSFHELKNKKEVKQMGYSFRKLMGKHQQQQQAKSTNSFEF